MNEIWDLISKCRVTPSNKLSIYDAIMHTWGISRDHAIRIWDVYIVPCLEDEYVFHTFVEENGESETVPCCTVTRLKKILQLFTQSRRPYPLTQYFEFSNTPIHSSDSVLYLPEWLS